MRTDKWFVAVTALVGLAAMATTGSESAGGASRPAGAALTAVRPSVAASDWTTFDQNPLRTGVDTSGNSFSPATPAWSSPHLDGQIYGCLLYTSDAADE